MKHRGIYFIIFIMFILPYIYSQSLSPEQVFEKVAPAVVQLKAYDADSSIMAWGSAVAVGDSGIFYTNMHIFEGAKRLVIIQGTITLTDIKVIGFDPDKDILILKALSSAIKGVVCFNSDSLKVGEVVYTIGNPQGYLNTISGGLLSGIRKDGKIQLQYNASISPGSSGGALINSRGELIGITSSYIKEGQNLNFAVPVNLFTGTCIINIYDSNEVNLMNEIVEVYNSQSKLNEDSVKSKFSNYSLSSINDRNSLYAVANLLSKGNSANNALNICNLGLSKFGDDKDFFLLRARLFSSMNKNDSALMDFNKSVEMDPLNETSLYERAMFLKDEFKDYKNAAVDFLTIVNTYQNREYIYLDLANICIISNDTSGAVKYIQKSYYGNAQDEYMFYMRGRILSDLGLNSEAAENFTLAIGYNPNYEGYYFSRAIANSKSGRYDKAITDYMKLLSINPDGNAVLNNAAYTFFCLHDYDEAEKYFLKAIKGNPKDFDNYIGLSITYDKLGKVRDCLRSMSKAIDLRPVLGKGMAGLDSTKKDGHFWSSLEEICIKQVFVKMGIEPEKDENTRRHGRNRIPDGALRRRSSTADSK